MINKFKTFWKRLNKTQVESLESGKKKKSVDKSEISLERTEEKIYDEQEKWIRSKFGAKAAETANYGWGVNIGDRDVTVSTKVYGHGVITSKGDSKGNIKHNFETF